MSELPFDLESAQNIDIRDLRGLVSSRGWQEFVEPFLFGAIARWQLELADPSLQRRWKRPDNYLRGGIKVCQALLRMPYDMIAEQDRRNREEKRDAEDEHREQGYERVGTFGHGPMGEDAQGISPSDPI